MRTKGARHPREVRISDNGFSVYCSKLAACSLFRVCSSCSSWFLLLLNFIYLESSKGNWSDHSYHGSFLRSLSVGRGESRIDVLVQSPAGLVSGKRRVGKPGSVGARHLVPYFQNTNLDRLNPPSFLKIYFEWNEDDAGKLMSLGS